MKSRQRCCEQGGQGEESSEASVGSHLKCSSQDNGRESMASRRECDRTRPFYGVQCDTGSPPLGQTPACALRALEVGRFADRIHGPSEPVDAVFCQRSRAERLLRPFSQDPEATALPAFVATAVAIPIVSAVSALVFRGAAASGIFFSALMRSSL